MRRKALLAIALVFTGASLSACWDHRHGPYGPGDRPAHQGDHGDHHDG